MTNPYRPTTSSDRSDGGPGRHGVKRRHRGNEAQNAASRSRSSARRRSHRGPTSRGRPEAHDPPRRSRRARARRGGHSNSDIAIRVDSATWSHARWAFGRMNRRVSQIIAGWRTGLSRPALILQGGNALNYFGYGLVLPFEIIAGSL